MGGLMATISKPQQRIPTAFWPLLVLALFGVGLAIYRLVAGLGPTTNMSDHYPWGIWITVDLFLIPVAGAAFTISWLSYFVITSYSIHYTKLYESDTFHVQGNRTTMRS